jgi:bla regulator protein blaR1
MTAAINLNPLARMLAERMLNSMIEGIAIALFAWLLLRMVGRRNSSTRFAVWFSALLAIAALPFVGSAPSANSVGRKVSALTLPGSWALNIFIVWAGIASMALVRVGAGLWQLRRLRARCTGIDPATLDPVLRRTLQEVQALRSVTLCQSDRLQVPTAIGFLKPLVVLPAWAMQELSTSELNSILIHELAHLRRWDDWTNLAQQILKALLFFHPAVWWIENKLALEREMACDDVVLAETANPRGYAQCLISIAEKSFMRRGIALAQAAVNRVRQTSMRVTEILDVNRSGATRVWKPALYSVTAFSIFSLIALSRAPELVAFQNSQANTVVASAAIPSGTSFSRAESNLLTGGTSAAPASMRTKRTRPVEPITRRNNRRQDPPKPVEARLLVPDTNRMAQAKPLSNTEPSNIASSPGNEATPQTIFVVMQSEQYSQAGLLWQVRVWRLTVFDSGRALVNPRIRAKRI